MLKIGLRFLTDVKKIIDQDNHIRQKAIATALKVEAFRLKKVGALLLKKGELGLTAKTTLRYKEDAKGKLRKQRETKTGKIPFRNFSQGFLYKFNPQTVSAEIGFVGNTAGTNWQRKVLKKNVPGYRWLYSKNEIKKLHGQGIHLKKITTSANVPPRDIIDAILRIEGEAKILDNIAMNFRRKMSGERI